MNLATQNATASVAATPMIPRGYVSHGLPMAAGAMTCPARKSPKMTSAPSAFTATKAALTRSHAAIDRTAGLYALTPKRLPGYPAERQPARHG